MNYSKHAANPLRSHSTEWLPAPSLETLGRERLLSLLVALGLVHACLVLAHSLDPAGTITAPQTLIREAPWTRTAFVLASASTVFFFILRLLVPRLPLRWGQPLAALAATLVVINSLGMFSLGATPGKTVAVMFAVLGAAVMIFCTRTLVIVLSVAAAGWASIAAQAGMDAEWWRFGATLLAAGAGALVLQRLQLRSIKHMLRHHQNEETKPAPQPVKGSIVFTMPTQQDDEERFRRWYEATFEGIAIHERGTILEANRALATLLGCELREIVGRNLLDWFTRSSRSVIEESILLGNFRPFEAVARRADKTELHLELFTKRFNYGGREVMVTALRDISERRRAAVAAEAEQLKLESQFRRQQALASISISGGETIEVGALLDRAAEAAADQLPAHAGAVVLMFEGETLALAASAIPQRARDAGFDPLVHMARVCDWIRETKVPFVAANVAHDDPFLVTAHTDFVSAYAAMPLLDGERVAGVLVAMETDQARHFTPEDLDFLDALATRAATAISRARLYSELRAANRQLQQQSAMLQAQNMDLAAAKQRAEEANAAKSEFLAKVSHELRTPLNGVVGMTDYLLTTELTPDQRESAEAMRLSSDLLLSNINRILDFSRLDSGTYAPTIRSFDPRELVTSLVAEASQMAHSEVRVHADVSAELPFVTGDRDGLHVVLSKILENAVKFTTAGEVVVTATSQMQAANWLSIRFEIRDTGPGMDDGTKARLFKSFTQGDGSLARPHEGLGLGLATAKQMLDRLQGQIEVESNPGHGSTFAVIVPFEKAIQPAPASA